LAVTFLTEGEETSSVFFIVIATTSLAATSSPLSANRPAPGSMTTYRNHNNEMVEIGQNAPNAKQLIWNNEYM
jgi:hypothetical protein